MMTTWRVKIANEMIEHDESWADVESIAPGSLDLDRQFSDGYGCAQGDEFTVWTRKRVYFPATYDGAEWVASVPREPNGEVTSHVGG